MHQESAVDFNTTSITRARECLMTGLKKAQTGEACEDVTYIRETPALCFYGLADGQSGRRYGAQGGCACLEAAAEFVQEYGIDMLTDHSFPDELPCMLMKTIREKLGQLAHRQNSDFSDFASTLLAVAIDPAAGNYVLIHLGDGCIIGVRKDDAVAMLSPPENGITAYHTWLTTSGQAVTHLHIGFGNLEHLKRIVLLTDGAEWICRGKNISRRGKMLLTRRSQENILEDMRKSRPADDAGCIVVDFFPEAASREAEIDDTRYRLL